MTRFIVLTPDQAAKVRGLTKTTDAKGNPDRHAIEPVPLEGDTAYILPLEVLDSPHHAESLDSVKTDAAKQVDLKDAQLQREVLPAEFKKTEEPDPKDAGEAKAK